MSCEKCDSERIMSVYGKCSDLGSYEVPHLDLEHNGYAPEIPGVCHGDDIQFDFCLDCGTIQGYEPITDDRIKEVFEET